MAKSKCDWCELAVRGIAYTGNSEPRYGHIGIKPPLYCWCPDCRAKRLRHQRKYKHVTESNVTEYLR